MLSGVNDVFNAIMVRGDEVGDVMFYGRGAGKFPTASAVVGDVIDCVKHLSARKYLFWEEGNNDYVADHESDVTKLYVRVKCENLADAQSEIEALFNEVNLIKDASKNEIAFITENEIESKLRNQLSLLTKSEPISILHAID